MSPLLFHSNTNQYNINGLLFTYNEMFRIQTCCNHILSAAEGFRGQEATCVDPGFFVSLFSPQLILQFKEGFQWFYCLKNFTKDPEKFHYNPGGGGGGPTFPGGGGGGGGGWGPNANFYRNPYTCLLFSRGGGVRIPYPPLDPHMGNVIITGQYLSQSGFLP